MRYNNEKEQTIPPYINLDESHIHYYSKEIRLRKKIHICIHIYMYVSCDSV